MARVSRPGQKETDTLNPQAAITESTSCYSILRFVLTNLAVCDRVRWVSAIASSRRQQRHARCAHSSVKNSLASGIFIRFNYASNFACAQWANHRYVETWLLPMRLNIVVSTSFPRQCLSLFSFFFLLSFGLLT